MEFKIDKFNGLKTVLYTFIICSIFAAVMFLIIAFIEREVNRPQYHTLVSGIIENIEVNDDDLLLKLVNYDNTFTGDFDKIEVQNFKEIIEVDNYVELIVSSKRINNKKTPIIKANYDGKEILNLEIILAKTVDSLVLASGISCGIAFVLIFIVILIKRKEKVKFVDFYDHFLPIYSYDFIDKNKRSFKEKEKRNSIAVFGYLGFIVILAILIVILGNKYPDYPHIIIPIVVILMAIGTYLLFKFTILYKSSSEDIKKFVELYLEYINKEVEDMENYEDEDDEIILMDDYMIFKQYFYDEEFIETEKNISYEELNFYVACVYKNSFHHAHIYICSDYNELAYPIYFKLNPYIYKKIKKHNIYVKNLEYLMNNLESEIIKNKPKFGAKVIKYKK